MYFSAPFLSLCGARLSIIRRDEKCEIVIKNVLIKLSILRFDVLPFEEAVQKENQGRKIGICGTWCVDLIKREEKVILLRWGLRSNNPRLHYRVISSTYFLALKTYAFN